MTTAEMKARDASCVMQTYGRFDVAIDRGCGATLYSPEGMKYIDFSSGIGVNSLGYGDEGWAGAVYKQAKKLQHISNLFYTEPYIALAETLEGFHNPAALPKHLGGVEVGITPDEGIEVPILRQQAVHPAKHDVGVFTEEEMGLK